MSARVTQSSLSPEAIRLAHALDQQPIVGARDGDWVALVLGVHADHRHVWMQVGRAGPERLGDTFVLCLPRRATAAQALAALRCCHVPTGGYPRLVHVMGVTGARHVRGGDVRCPCGGCTDLLA